MSGLTEYSQWLLKDVVNLTVGLPSAHWCILKVLWQIPTGPSVKEVEETREESDVEVGSSVSQVDGKVDPVIHSFIQIHRLEKYTIMADRSV